MIPGETTEPMALPNIYGDMQLSYNMHLPIQKKRKHFMLFTSTKGKYNTE